MILLLTDGNGLPVVAEIHAANRAEVKVIDSLVERIPLEKYPQRLIEDKAADSNELRDHLEWLYDIELISLHRKTANGQGVRTGENYGGTNAAGKWNELSLGCKLPPPGGAIRIPGQTVSGTSSTCLRVHHTSEQYP